MSWPQHPTCYQDTHLTVDFDREVAYLDGGVLKLTFKAYSLLAFLVRREDLLSLVWGYTNEIRTRTLDVHIRRLRKCLGHYGVSYIETIFGIGYRFQPHRAAAEQSDAIPAPGVTSAPPRTMAAGSVQ